MNEVEAVRQQGGEGEAGGKGQEHEVDHEAEAAQGDEQAHSKGTRVLLKGHGHAVVEAEDAHKVQLSRAVNRHHVAATD